MQHFTPEKTLSLSAKTCDRCRRRAEKDDLEFQEFLTIDHRAGYGPFLAMAAGCGWICASTVLKEVLGQWLTQREEFDKGIQALNAFVERAGLFTR
ncbi:type II toxin-antitoxin system CcdA family antitoxin [Klebsiella pneumoniae subsp. pneumoniae]|nr:type II toxin-antitoxin system CcdA family antitoxin [Klebsiella pneumoniae subsp. pneumoniae]